MSDRVSLVTAAQKETHWDLVVGQRVAWTGDIWNVKLDGGGYITLRCNPVTFTHDVAVDLDGTQLDKIVTLKVGQTITIYGTLDRHTMSGYRLSNGYVAGLQ
jgi:hypothetical protein